MDLNITYLGGIEEQDRGYSLTGSSTLFELMDSSRNKIHRLLVDAGSFQGSRDEETKNNELPENVDNIDTIIATHAHLDHIGRIPYLVKNGFNGIIYMTKTTFELSKLNWFDSVKIDEKNKNISAHIKRKIRDYLTASKLNIQLQNNNIKLYKKEEINNKINIFTKKHKKTLKEMQYELLKYNITSVQDIENIKKKDGLYTEEDIYLTIGKIKILGEGKRINIHNFINVQFYDAAHIEGSVIPCITYKTKKGKNFKVGVLQDIGRLADNPIEKIPQIPTKLDFVQMETTYGGKHHPSILEGTKTLINEIVIHDGPILIPAFAIQRTQFIIKILIENLKKIPGNKKIYVTSAMAEEVKKSF